MPENPGIKNPGIKNPGMRNLGIEIADKESGLRNRGRHPAPFRKKSRSYSGAEVLQTLVQAFQTQILTLFRHQT